MPMQCVRLSFLDCNKLSLRKPCDFDYAQTWPVGAFHWNFRQSINTSKWIFRRYAMLILAIAKFLVLGYCRTIPFGLSCFLIRIFWVRSRSTQFIFMFTWHGLTQIVFFPKKRTRENRPERFERVTVTVNFNKIRRTHIEQEAQLSQRGRAMPRVVEYFG